MNYVVSNVLDSYVHVFKSGGIGRALDLYGFVKIKVA